MTRHRTINITLTIAWALAFAFVLGWVGPELDGPSDHSTEIATAADLQDAIKAEAKRARFARAAAQICGENAGWTLTPDNALQCTTKRGHKTQKVSL